MALSLLRAVTPSRCRTCPGKADLGRGHIPSCATGSSAAQHPLHKAASCLEKAESGRNMQALYEQT